MPQPLYIASTKQSHEEDKDQRKTQKKHYCKGQETVSFKPQRLIDVQKQPISQEPQPTTAHDASPRYCNTVAESKTN